MANRGFTLIELLVSIAILGVLVSMIMPAIHIMRENAYQAKCANNQRNILTAALSYMASELDWPCRPTTTSGAYDTNSAPDPLYSAIGTLEMLAVTANCSNKLFACPSDTLYMPQNTPSVGNGAVPDLSVWASLVGGGQTLAMPGYAFDWSTPANPVASRVVIADRGRITLSHMNRSVCGYSDAHVGKLMMSFGTAGTSTTANLDGSTATITGSLFLNPDAGDDNVYDSNDDDGSMTGPGFGSVSRSWVR